MNRADRKRKENLQQAKKIREREGNIRARAEAKKANKGKRGKPVSFYFFIFFAITNMIINI